MYFDGFMITPSLLGVILVVLVILTLVFVNIRIVPQGSAYVIERLGKFHTVWYAGLHVKIPVIDCVRRIVTLKEQVADFPPQSVITKDNVTMHIDTVTFFQIIDPKLYVYGIENAMIGIENYTATTLRNLIGDLELDETLTSRDTINTKMSAILDEATDPWGIKVSRVELKNIIPPSEIQDAMEKQMKAERERRENILRAEGEKRAAILTAEGEKESAVLRAEAQKVQLIKEAEGNAESIRLQKEAEASGIKAIKDAEQYGIEVLLKTGLTNQQVVTLKSYEAFAKAADGQATKIIVPSDIQKLSSLVASVKEL